jgi:hypothetical protein
MNFFESASSFSTSYHSHLVTFSLPVPYRFTTTSVDEFLAETVGRMNAFHNNGYDRGISFWAPGPFLTKAVRIEYWLHSMSWHPQVPVRTDVAWCTSVRPLNCHGPGDRPTISHGISGSLSGSDRLDAEVCMEHHKYTAKAGICRLPGSGRPLGAKDKQPRKRRKK